MSEKILNPTIHWLGIIIEEPVTSATDFLTSLVCYFSFIMLSRIECTAKHCQLLRLYFLLMALATTSAAFLGHALQAYISSNFKMSGWCFGALAICLLELASIEIAKNQLKTKTFNFLKILIFTHLFIFYILLLFAETRNFNLVKINSSIALFGVILPVHVFYYSKTQHSGSKWFIIAIGWSLLPAIMYNAEMSFSRWFNFHDISHVLMAIYTLILYKGSLKFFTKKL